jgi:ubiquinone/menaquinone biosynthesis C-methylase UbiE
MKKEIAEKILQETETGYDLISEKFSQTRKHFWRGLEFLKDYTHPGDRVFDFGCGNGRLLELIGDVPDVEYYGADVSQKLIDIAKERYVAVNANFSKINPIQDTLPFESDFFNTTYSIAVFHHFPSKEYRDRIAQELYRVTKKDGYVIITVWNLWPAAASLWRGKQKKYFKNILRNLFDKVKGKSELEIKDCMISFTDNNGVKFQRFHHAFTKRELKKLFEKAGFKIERCEIVDGRNILLVGKKMKIG